MDQKVKDELDLLADTIDIIRHGLTIAIFHQDRESMAKYTTGLDTVRRRIREIAKS